MPIAPTESAIAAWLDSVPNRERSGEFRDMQLDGVRALVALLPPVPAPCTVAGTKGKGSTVRLIECGLLAAGEKTVAFTSPHVLSVLERWRVDGKNAEPAMIAAACTTLAELEQQHQLTLTYFERTFAIACLLASQRPQTRFIVEVGLGGRLDCANALDAAVAVITHLSHDHRDILGPTLDHIAREKLAIIRPAAHAVIGPQIPTAALAIWRNISRFRAGKSTAHTAWVQRHTTYELPLLGDHQQDNAATAHMAIHLWAPHISDAVVRQGFAQATMLARCQLIERDGRTLLIDGAHNRESIAATLAVAQKKLRTGWRLIIGVAKDKEIDEIMSIIPAGVSVTRCAYNSPRARQRDDWPAAAQLWRWCDTINEAIAVQPAQVDICVTGSFYLAGEALEISDLRRVSTQ
jgi:dihydrofolate synthase / folylpolyglutamate synthase